MHMCRSISWSLVRTVLPYLTAVEEVFTFPSFFLFTAVSLEKHLPAVGGEGAMRAGYEQLKIQLVVSIIGCLMFVCCQSIYLCKKMYYDCFM